MDNETYELLRVRIMLALIHSPMTADDIFSIWDDQVNIEDVRIVLDSMHEKREVRLLQDGKYVV